MTMHAANFRCSTNNMKLNVYDYMHFEDMAPSPVDGPRTNDLYRHEGRACRSLYRDRRPTQSSMVVTRTPRII